MPKIDRVDFDRGSVGVGPYYIEGAVIERPDERPGLYRTVTPPLEPPLGGRRHAVPGRALSLFACAPAELTEVSDPLADDDNAVELLDALGEAEFRTNCCADCSTRLGSP